MMGALVLSLRAKQRSLSPGATRLPQLVLLPGLDGTGRLFAPFEAALGADVARTVVAYSAPEVSSYDACREVARSVLPVGEPYVLVGESFSGPVAVTIAAAKPPGLCGLVLAGSFVRCPRPALRFATALLPFLPAHSGAGWLSDYLLLGRFADPARREMIREALAMVTPHGVRLRLREIARVDVRSSLAQVTVPVLYLRATEDRLVPQACADDVACLAQDVTIVVVAAPHLILQCAPDAAARAITSFLRECVQTSP